MARSSSLSASFQRINSLDLLNIEYDDILYLYRGFRKAEGLLADTQKEFDECKKQYSLLQDAYSNCTAKLQSLEAIKDAAMQLEAQIVHLKGENEILLKDNHGLAQINIQAEELLRDKSSTENKFSQSLREKDAEIERLNSKIDEIVKSNFENEIMTSKEEELRETLENKVIELKSNVEKLKDENFSLKKKMDISTDRLRTCDNDLRLASEQLLELSREVATMSESDRTTQFSNTENSILKRDISRLLRLFDNFPSSASGGGAPQLFLTKWKDSNGLSYIDKCGGHTASDDSIEVLNKLTKRYSKNTDPIPAYIEEELANWVPRKALLRTKEYSTNALASVDYDVLIDYIREMNKIWYKRENVKIQRIKELFRHQIIDYKRQLSNRMPYKEIMDERHIKRLKHQVLSTRKKYLTGHPVNKKNHSLVFSQNRNYFENIAMKDHEKYLNASYEFKNKSLLGSSRKSRVEEYDTYGNGPEDIEDDDDSSVSSVVFSGNKSAFVDRNRKVYAQDVSLKSLLEESIANITNKTQRIHPYSQEKKSRTSGKVVASVKRRDQDRLRSSQIRSQEQRYEYEGEEFPTDEFLNGSLWFGRSLLLLIERVAEEVREVGTRLRGEGAILEGHGETAGADTTSSVLEKHGEELRDIAVSGVQRAKELMQGLAEVEVGDDWAFNNFQRKLVPITHSSSSVRFAPELEEGDHSEGEEDVELGEYFSPVKGSRYKEDIYEDEDVRRSQRRPAGFMSPSSLSDSPIMRTSVNTPHSLYSTRGRGQHNHIF